MNLILYFVVGALLAFTTLAYGHAKNWYEVDRVMGAVIVLCGWPFIAPVLLLWAVFKGLDAAAKALGARTRDRLN